MLTANSHAQWAVHHGCGHEEPRQELARHIHTKHYVGALAALPIRTSQFGCTRQPKRVNVQRRTAVLIHIIDLRAKLAQDVHKLADRALMQSRRTMNAEVATPCGQNSGEQAAGCAGLVHIT